MRFENTFKGLHLACSQDDSDRPPLGCINVEALDDATAEVVRELNGLRESQRVGIAVAANGYILAAVPVCLDDADVLGVLPREAWKAARANRDADCEIELTETQAVVRGLPFERRPAQTAWDRAFPDWRRIASYTEPKRRTPEATALNPRLFALVGKALGVGPDDGLGVYLGPKATGVVLLSRCVVDPKLPFVPPFGLLMPMVAKYALKGAAK